MVRRKSIFLLIRVELDGVCGKAAVVTGVTDTGAGAVMVYTGRGNSPAFLAE